MKDTLHHGAAWSRSLERGGFALVLLALASIVCLASPASAPAHIEYQHGPIEDCETCHESAHTDRMPLSFVCFTCHADFQVVRPGDECWTCHTPAQQMDWARTDAGCLSTCHLRDPETKKYDVSFTHTPHAGGSAACTSCHSVAASTSESARSAHHTVPAPVLASVTPTAAAPGATITLSGTNLSWVNFVGFGGSKAVYTIVSDTTISAVVPDDAATGPVTVLGGGGRAIGPADFVVLRPGPPQAPVLTFAASRRTLAPGARVKLSGTLSPFDPAQVVRVVVQRRAAGSWRAAASASRPLGASGAFSWSWRPARAGAYRARASTAGISSGWAAFSAR